MISDAEKLRRFREEIQSRISGVEWARPFVCDGSPYECTVFLVGFNPASNVPFWEFWLEGCGFDKAGWLNCYRAQRRSARRPEVSPSRRRIECLIAAAKSANVLETNLYAKPTKKQRCLHKADQNSSAFRYMVGEIQPRILLLHGAKTCEHFCKLYKLDSCPTHEFTDICINGRMLRVASVPHFSARPHYWSADRVIELGRRVGTEVRGAGIA